MGVTKRRGRGRPQIHVLTPAQEKRIIILLNKGKTSAEIEDVMGIHPFAVLRVKRGMK